MLSDKKHGVYLEYTNIPNKELSDEFIEMFNMLLECNKLKKCEDGWYYPDVEEGEEYDCVQAFCFIIATDFKKFHEYIGELMYKKGEEIIDYMQQVIEAGDW